MIPTNTLSHDELASIEICRSLVVEFASLIDEGRTDEIIHLLVDDASFARPTVPDVIIRGAREIIAAFAARPKTLVSQHLNLNIRIELTGPDTAKGESLVMVYLADSGETPEPGKGRKARGPMIGIWSDTFVRTAAGWRFKDRRGRATLTA